MPWQNVANFPKCRKSGGARGVMKEKILVLRRDVAGHSPDFKMELTEKLNYYEGEKLEAIR